MFHAKLSVAWLCMLLLPANGSAAASAYDTDLEGSGVDVDVDVDVDCAAWEDAFRLPTLHRRGRVSRVVLQTDTNVPAACAAACLDGGAAAQGEEHRRHVAHVLLRLIWISVHAPTISPTS